MSVVRFPRALRGLRVHSSNPPIPFYTAGTEMACNPRHRAATEYTPRPALHRPPSGVTWRGVDGGVIDGTLVGDAPACYAAMSRDLEQRSSRNVFAIARAKADARYATRNSFPAAP